MTKKAANEVDRHVGTRVRMRRMQIGMSQEKLGDALGVTFQQVQKYEKGTNRISASRLSQMSSILGVGITYFYDGAPNLDGAVGSGQAAGFSEESAAAYEPEVMTADGLKLLRAVQRIPSPKVRRKLLDLAVALSSDPDGNRSE